MTLINPLRRMTPEEQMEFAAETVQTVGEKTSVDDSTLTVPLASDMPNPDDAAQQSVWEGQAALEPEPRFMQNFPSYDTGGGQAACGQGLQYGYPQVAVQYMNSPGYTMPAYSPVPPYMCGYGSMALTPEDCSALKASFYTGAMTVAKEKAMTEQQEKRNKQKLEAKYQELQMVQDVRDDAEVRRNLKGYVVFSLENKMMLSVKTPGRTNFRYRSLMDEPVISIERFQYDCPDGKTEMHLTIELNGEKTAITYDPYAMMEHPENFLTLMRKHGAHLHVPEVASKDIATEFLNCLDGMAKDKSIPPGTGYYRNAAGEWNFKSPDMFSPDDEEHCTDFTDSEKFLLILQTAAAVYPVLSDWNIRPVKPITVIADDNVDIVLRNLEGKCPVYTSADKKSEIDQALKKIDISPVMFFHDFSFKGNSRVDYLVSRTKMGSLSGSEVFRLPIIVADRIPSEKNQADLFLINFDSESKTKSNSWTFLPSPNEFALIKEKISQLQGDSGRTGHFLKAATCFLYPWFVEANKLQAYLDLQKYVDELVELEAQSQDLMDVPELFLKCLYEYKKLNPGVRLVDIEEATRADLEAMGNTMFHNFTYLYMSSDLFEAVVWSLRKIAKPDRIKLILADAEILVTLQTGYTSRMSVTDEDGKLHRPRMLKFKMDLLKQTGGLDFINVYGGK